MTQEKRNEAGERRTADVTGGADSVQAGRGNTQRDATTSAPAITPSGATGPGLKAGALQEIDAQLATVTFPTTKNHLMETVGNQRLVVNGVETSVQELIGKLGRDRFETRNDVIESIKLLPEVGDTR